MTEMNSESAGKNESDSATEGSNRTSTFRLWVVVLMAYILLLVSVGYIAFFQPAFNPGLDIEALSEVNSLDESALEFTIESLREEGVAFKQRRELAVHSFNIVLGASLGFLAALASQSLMNRQKM